jgi:mRNA-degrading endonuclease RelE of RelBE toxin-antitoxin system
MYEVRYQPDAAAELNALRAFDRVRILDAISRNLTNAPAEIRGSKKMLDLGGGSFIRQLRVGDYRVFYDVDEAESLVIVQHVRRKGQKTTGEIL